MDGNHIFTPAIHDLADDLQPIPMHLHGAFFILAASGGNGVFTGKDKVVVLTVEIKFDIGFPGVGTGCAIYDPALNVMNLQLRI